MKWGVGGGGTKAMWVSWSRGCPDVTFCWLLFLSWVSNHKFNWLGELTWLKITHYVQIILFFRVVPLERSHAPQQLATWESPLHENMFQNEFSKMPQILLLSYKMLAIVISTGRLVTVTKMLTLKMLSLFNLVTAVKEPRKGLQTSVYLTPQVQNRKVEWIPFAKPWLCQGPLQESNPECLESIINLHSEPGNDFLDIWSPNHTVLIHAAHVEKGMAGEYLQSPKRDQLWTEYSNCLLLLCWLWTGKVLDPLHWIYILECSKGSPERA